MKRNVIFWIFGFIVLLIVFSACQSVYIRTARLAIRDENDPDKALKNLEMEIKVNPNSADAYLFMSQIYGEFKSDYANSYKYAKKAMEIDFNKSEEVNKIFKTCWSQSHNKGIKEFEDENYENALNSFKLANKISPDSIVTTKMLASVYSNLDSLEMAKKIYIEIANKLPDDIPSRSKLAEFYFNGNDFENAIKYYQELANIESENVNWIYNIAVCYSNMNEAETSLEYYKKAVEINPDDKNLLYKIADSEFNKRNYSQAIKFYRKIIEIDNTELDAIKFICYSLSNEKNYEDLIIYAKKWLVIESDNNDAQQFLNLGRQKIK